MFKLAAQLSIFGVLFIVSQVHAAPAANIGMRAKISYKFNDLHRRASDWFWRLGVEDFFYRTTGGSAGYDETYLRKEGNYYISSSNHYYVRSYRRGRPEKDPMYDLNLEKSRRVLAEPSLVG